LSQQIWTSINPLVTNGTRLAALLVDFKDALMSGLAGTTRPTELQAGGVWIDTTNQSSPTYYWSFKLWTGTVDAEIFRLNTDVGYGGSLVSSSPFETHHYGADVTGPILQLIKQRRPTVNNGQVLDGDVVGEIRMVGRTDTSTDPVVAKIIFNASDGNTTSAYGGSLGLYSTPDATAALTQHLRLISGLVETTVPHKINSEVTVTQNVATAASIAALDTSKVGVEMTGATATDIRGIDSTGYTREIMIHNRSSATVTLKHENTSATAANRMTLPAAADISLRPQDSAVLLYCSADSRWKIKSSTSRVAPVRTIDTVMRSGYQWTAPASMRVRIVAYGSPLRLQRSGLIDAYGNAFLWGSNVTGCLADGTVTNRSSPVAALGGLAFKSLVTPDLFVEHPIATFHECRMAIAVNGSAYAWGANNNGQLGVGDVTPRSSPVAVLGGFKFQSIKHGGAGEAFLGLTTNGSAYAWGVNTNGQLGVGNTASRSSPVAVLGGLTFSSIEFRTDSNSGGGYAFGITAAGVAYAWGANTYGNLGVGNTTDRSSPVAVLGSLTFAAIKTNKNHSGGTAYSCLGLTTAGALYAWGDNTNGQLGLGDVTPRSSPVAVLGGLTFVDFGMTASSSWGITSTGALYMWGDNSRGECAVGDRVDRSSPVASVGGLSFKKVSSTDHAVFGLTNDGALYSWGYDSGSATGIMGQGSTAASSSPVAVLGGFTFSDFNVSSIADIKGRAMAMRMDGSVYAWGYNASGELGVGDTTSRSSPVAVLGTNAADNSVVVSETSLTVVAATAYTVMISECGSSFGNVPLGTGINKVTITYDR
jgi:alpha-tubulin suppressor-like RCC1 family protein